ncbi:MAG: PorT family protein [Flavobacteriaceae bacterium]|nr:PorT family protein [Flavobacteriaceae bacterium]
MKKLLFLGMFFIGAISMSAQGIDFGIKAGVNFASIADATGFDNRTGFVAGVFVGGKLNDKVGLQADLLYSQQGAEFDGGEFNLDYVNVPVVIKIFLSETFHVHGGPQFGFVANDELKSDVGAVADGFKTNNFDLSGVIGIGADLPMGLRFDGRYNFGFTKTNEELKVLGETAVEEGRNSVVTLSIGYAFL